MANLKISSFGLAASGEGSVETPNTLVCGCLPLTLIFLLKENYIVVDV